MSAELFLQDQEGRVGGGPSKTSDSGSNALFLALDALSGSFLSKTSDSGSNALFLAMDAPFCSCLSKASDSDSKLLCLALDSLARSLLILIVRYYLPVLIVFCASLLSFSP